MELDPITLTQSRNWWQNKNLDWFIENAEFVFRKRNPVSYKSRRIWIKTKVPYNHNEEADYEPKLNFNCFEFDTDIHGIIIKCETIFCDTPPNDNIIDVNFNVKQAFVKYLEKEDLYGGGELKFLNPNLLRRLLSFRKSRHIKIK